MDLNEAFIDCIKTKWLRMPPKKRIKWKYEFKIGILPEQTQRRILQAYGYHLSVAEQWDVC